VRELIEEWDDTTGTADLLIAVDNDDPMLEAYQTLDLDVRSIPGILSFYYGPRKRIGPTLNQLAVENCSEYMALGFMGDDHRPRTVNWDMLYMHELMEMGTGIVYGNDLLQGENIPTQVAMTSDIVRAMGYMVPPKCIHLFFDNMWKVLGTELDRLVYLPEVIVEHMHPINGKSDVDSGYIEVNSPATYAHDQREFELWMKGEKDAAVQAIREIMITREDMV